MTSLTSSTSLGAACLYAGIAGALVAIVAGGLSVWKLSPRWSRAAHVALVVMTLAIVGSAAILGAALIENDLQSKYVWAHSSGDTPLVFRIAAMWSGNGGSLLMFAALTGIVGCVIVRALRGTGVRGRGAAMCTIALVVGWISLAIAFGDSPFAPTEHTFAGSGRGLDIRLRHWGMVVHPPLIMLGYSACVGAMALTLAATSSAGAKESRVSLAVVQALRACAMLAVASLGAGLLVGARWAYSQLGWGGYWNWDPVENASLVPLLMVIGLVHGLVVDGSRVNLSQRTIAFATLAGSASVLGTWLTRSGSLASVHTFAQAAGSWWSLVLALMLIAVGVIAARLAKRSGATPAETPPNIGAVQFIGWTQGLLLVAAAGTLSGTLAPIVTGWYSDRPVGVTTAFYHRLVVAPLVLAVILMIGGAWANRRVSCSARQRESRSFNVRRGGALLAHAGAAVLAIGFAASSLFDQKLDATLRAGESALLGDCTLSFLGAREFHAPGSDGVQADVRLTSASGASVMLAPTRRFDAKDPTQNTAEAAMHAGLLEDVCVTLTGWDAGGERVALHVRRLPLASFIWLGGAMCAGGTMLALAGPACAHAARSWLRGAPSRRSPPRPSRPLGGESPV